MPHDTDRTQLEFSNEFSEYGASPELSSEQYEYSELGDIMKSIFGEAPGSYQGGGYQEYQELPLPEVFEDELASELLEVRSDQELDHFIGSLFNKVTSAIGKAVNSPVGQALGGVLKQVAKQALPMVGKAVGSYFGGPVGGALGSQLASTAGDAFGLELSGLSPEDRDFEAARRYVRFAGEATKRAARERNDVEPRQVARKALVEAAQLHAPGLLAPGRFGAPSDGFSAPGSATGQPAYPPPRPDVPPSGVTRPVPPVNYPRVDYDTYGAQSACPACSGDGTSRRTGKWVRRGRHIVLLGV
jgi:hypothetical protein